MVTRFVQETDLEEELARDILAGTEWNYENAMDMFNTMLRTNDRRLSFSSPRGPSGSSSSSPQMVGQQQSYGRKVETVVEDPASPEDRRTIHRGISYAHLKGKGGKKIQLPTAQENLAKVDTNGYYFMLPDLHVLSKDLSRIIKKDLLDLEMMKHLHKNDRLNWWSSSNVCAPLYAMTTSGDGNCLLHATSLSVWGMHDRSLTLRTALNKVLTDEKFTVRMKKIQRRWKRQQIKVNRELGLEYTAAEWEEEWESVLKLSSTKPRHFMSGEVSTRPSQDSIKIEEATYESLEEIHVFVLAHVLLRPIIVVADEFLRDVHGEPLAPNTFGGIFLPLECPPGECLRSPLVLAYDASHFCALVPMHNSKTPVPGIIPITDANGNLLPVQFSVDPGVSWKFNESKDITADLSVEGNLALLEKYLDIIKIPVSPHRQINKSKITPKDLSSKEFIIGALLSTKRHPEYDVVIRDYLTLAEKKCAQMRPATVPSSSPLSSPSSVDSLPSYEEAMRSSSSKDMKGSRSPTGPPKYGTSRSRDYFDGSQPSQGYVYSPKFTAEGNVTTIDGVPVPHIRKALRVNQIHSPPAPINHSSYSRAQVSAKKEVQSPKLGFKASPKGDVSRPCRNKYCSFYGTEKTSFYCTQCYQAITER